MRRNIAPDRDRWESTQAISEAVIDDMPAEPWAAAELGIPIQLINPVRRLHNSSNAHH